MTINRLNENDYKSSLSVSSGMIIIIAITLGCLAAIFVLPNWLPNLVGSLTGPTPKVFWYLSRATAFVAMGLLWSSMMLGVSITNKMTRLWPGAPAAFAFHEYLSLLGLGFAGFHGLVLLGDHYSNFSLFQILIPFTAWNYFPFWVGLGQLGLYAWALLVISFYIRNQIGKRAWRLLHFLSFLVYLGAMVHGLTIGTDSGLDWVQAFYWLTGGSFLFMFIYRLVNILVDKEGNRGQASFSHKLIRE